jgi:mRNA interferase RelE/StbE
MRFLVTPTFARTVKKLHHQQKLDLDAAVRTIAADTTAGEAKVGDLAGVQVYKFKMTGQLCLPAYRVLDPHTIKLLMADPHENFFVISTGSVLELAHATITASNAG